MTNCPQGDRPHFHPHEVGCSEPDGIVVQGEERPDGTVEFPPPPRGCPAARGAAGKLNTPPDRHSDEWYESESERIDLMTDLVAQIAKMHPEVIRMAQVADLIAAARSKNRYQLTDEQSEALAAAERILVKISGAYAVPDLFQRVLVCREQK